MEHQAVGEVCPYLGWILVEMQIIGLENMKYAATFLGRLKNFPS